jgi:hypothetical protein
MGFRRPARPGTARGSAFRGRVRAPADGDRTRWGASRSLPGRPESGWVFHGGGLQRSSARARGAARAPAPVQPERGQAQDAAFDGVARRAARPSPTLRARPRRPRGRRAASSRAASGRREARAQTKRSQPATSSLALHPPACLASRPGRGRPAASGGASDEGTRAMRTPHTSSCRRPRVLRGPLGASRLRRRCGVRRKERQTNFASARTVDFSIRSAIPVDPTHRAASVYEP